jgi:hypothetical protein
LQRHAYGYTVDGGGQRELTRASGAEYRELASQSFDLGAQFADLSFGVDEGALRADALR